MPGPRDHIAFLSQEVGPRPAGTEEEQQAALYITEKMQKDAGLSAVIEDFNSESNEELPQAICAIFTFVLTILAMIFPVMAIPSLIVAALAALLYAAETFDKPIISKLLARGVSQNVVAKYEPGYSPEKGGSRRRKIILVANYDSGKVRPELKGSFLGVLAILQKLILGAMIFIPVFLLIRYLFFLHADGIFAIVLNVITIIALMFVLVPIILLIVHKVSPYNEAANCNASGVAVLLEIARRVGRGRVNSAELAAQAGSPKAMIHGEELARSSGLVPEGAKLVYEASQVQPPELVPQTEEERLASAKAAIAAMTGHPVPHKEQSSIAENLVRVKESPFEAPSTEEEKEIRDETREAFSSVPPETLQLAQENAAQALLRGQGIEYQEGMLEPGMIPGLLAQSPGEVPQEKINGSFAESSQSEPPVPDWFKKAQENAKKPKESKANKVQRSRYADALNAAVAESSSHFNEANRAVNAKTEERLRKMRDGIMEVSAPQAPPLSLNEQRSEGKADEARHPSDSEAMPLSQHVPPSAPSGTQSQEQTRREQAQNEQGTTTSIPRINVFDLPNVSTQSAQGEAPSQDSEQDIDQRKPIVLPDIGASNLNLAPVESLKQQRAPLAVAEESSQVAAKSLLNMLPSIEVGEGSSAGDAEATQAGDTQSKSRPDLRNSLPSLSGALGAIQPSKSNDQATQTSSVSATGSFVSSGATGTFSPVGDELIENVDPDDIYIEDADDSVYEGSLTETGAFAGPGYVEMPKSRVRRFFDKFSSKKNKENDAVSTKEWIDVDEDFDARSAGAARGGWESFQQEQYDDELPEGDSDQPEQDRRNSNKDQWEGGAFSKRRAQQDSKTEKDLSEPEGFAEARDLSLPSQANEMQQIYQFRHPDLDTEIWFVALGSELANNGGMKSFLTEHEQDLRGSIVININALGSGELCYLQKEGFNGKTGASSRMKRYVKKASQASGVDIDASNLRWMDSAATVASGRGFQAMSIMGMDGAKPARYAQGDDVLENIDDETLHKNADFIMELIRNI